MLIIKHVAMLMRPHATICCKTMDGSSMTVHLSARRKLGKPQTRINMMVVMVVNSWLKLSTLEGHVAS